MPCPDSLLQQGKECWAPPSSVGCPPEGSARGYEQTGQAKKNQPLKCQWLGVQEVQGQDCARFCLQVGRFCQNNVEHASWGKYFKINIKRISGRYAYYIIIYIYMSFHCKKNMSNLNLNNHKLYWSHAFWLRLWLCGVFFFVRPRNQIDLHEVCLRTFQPWYITIQNLRTEHFLVIFRSL